MIRGQLLMRSDVTIVTNHVYVVAPPEKPKQLQPASVFGAHVQTWGEGGTAEGTEGPGPFPSLVPPSRPSPISDLTFCAKQLT